MSGGQILSVMDDLRVMPDDRDIASAVCSIMPLVGV